MDHPSSPANRVLHEIFAFRPDDLRANRQGRLSQKQRGGMERRHHENCRLAWRFFVVIAVLAFAGSAAAALSKGDSLLPMWQAVTFFLAFTAFTVWLSVWYTRGRLRHDLCDGAVCPVQGRVRLVRPGGKEAGFYFSIGNCFASLNAFKYQKLQQAGVEGLPATAYITARSGAIMSVDLET